MDAGAAYLEDAIRQFQGTKKLAQKALAQVGDEDFFRKIDPESNSLALIVKHIAGNMLSRWTDFLSSDGEKPERRRDSEFEIEIEADTRAALMDRWEEGGRCLFRTLEGLRPEDLLATVVIRASPHTVLKAINRQLAHYSQHVGQIVFLAKHLAGPRWQSPSIPRGQSEQVNAKSMSPGPKDSL
jgi:hypothetical protein